MNRYSLVIDIPSDEEDFKNSTPIKTLPLNMVGRLNFSDTSIEAWRGSEADPNSSYYSGCSLKTPKVSPIRMKNAKVTFNLPPAHRSMNSEPDSDDYYEEPDTPQKPKPLKPSRKQNVPPTKEKTAGSQLNDLNEIPTRIETVEDYRKAWHTPQAEEYFQKLNLELEKEEKRSVHVCRTRERSASNKKLYFTPRCGDKERNPPLSWATRVSGLESGPVTSRSRTWMQLLLYNRGRGCGRGYCKYQ